MKTLEKEVSTEYIIKKSKFFGYGKNINSKESALNFIENIKKRHYDANHNVFAYVFMDGSNKIYKYSDDGEPKNTAGKPVYDVLYHNNIINTVVAVSRYFGGVKLGAGGLVRAYSMAARLVVENHMVRYIKKETMLIKFNYNVESIIEHHLKLDDIEIINKDYGEIIKFNILASEEEKEKLDDIKEILI